MTAEATTGPDATTGPEPTAPTTGTGATASRRPTSQGARSRGRLAGWVVLAAVLLGALVFGMVDDTGPRTPDERARNLAESIACPQCDGQSVADSDAEAARGIRTVIERRIDEGLSDAEIRDEIAASYTERVLLTPGRSGVSSLVWTLPVVVVVVAFAGLALAFRRWRGGGADRASDADRALVARARAASGADDRADTEDGDGGGGDNAADSGTDGPAAVITASDPDGGS